jgi:hypothetical protein
MKKTLILGVLSAVVLSCDIGSTVVEPQAAPAFFTLFSQIDPSGGLPSPQGVWILASDDSGNWIDAAYVSGGDIQLNGLMGVESTFDLHIFENMGNQYRVETWLDVPVNSEWQLTYEKQHGYPRPPWLELTYDQALAVVPNFKGTIIDSRKSWRISGVNGDQTTTWGFQQSDLNSGFRFPKGDNDVIYSDIVDNECLYERSIGFQPSDTITISNLKSMDRIILMDYPDNTMFHASFYGFRNRDNLNTGLFGFINSQKYSPSGQVPATKMGYVNGFFSYRTLVDVAIGKRSMSYEKNGSMIESAIPFTNIDVAYASKHPNAFDGTPNMRFDYFEATWSRSGVPVWTVHGPGNGEAQNISFIFQPLSKEVTGDLNLDLARLKFDGLTLTQYSQEFEYSDNFPTVNYAKPRKVYAEVFSHTIHE